MNTRKRSARASAGSGDALVTPTRKKEESPAKQEPNHDNDITMVAQDDQENEHDVVIQNPRTRNGAIAKGAKRGKKKSSQTGVLKVMSCICSRGDDGSPMVICSACQIWYHFTCVDLTEPDGEDINVFICPFCTEATGRRTTRNWEGDEALEQCLDDTATILSRRKTILKKLKDKADAGVEGNTGNVNFDDGSERQDDSEDEYVEKDAEGRRSAGKRLNRLRRGSTATVEDHSGDSDQDSETPRRRKSRFSHPGASPSLSPGPSHLKRKAARDGSAPPSKRKKAAVNSISTVDSDPARKYCLGKMEDIFKNVFLKYPHVRMITVEDNEETMAVTTKKPDELTDVEKDSILEDAKRFARELESCVFDIYAEPDRSNIPSAGPKYKDRFRTLQFNLSKPDRVVIHQKITSGALSAKEISTMSSTDLADEETKQSIKLAEKEALEHSILLKQAAPRAKITHKGLQDIEDVRGELLSAHELAVQKEREEQEEERRDRERLARLKSINSQRQRTLSMSVPPESPTTPHQIPSPLESNQQPSDQSWGAPPPVPLHAMAHSNSERPPLFIHSSSDYIIPSLPLSEPELNLTDLINIDDDQEDVMAADASGRITVPDMVASPIQDTSTDGIIGVSPFAQRQDRPRMASFDLNALWSQAGRDESTEPPAEDDSKDETPKASTNDLPRPLPDNDKDESMDLESVEANDQDLDMLLAEEPDKMEPAAPLTVEDLDVVWTGKIHMPLDSNAIQEPPVVAKQIGGKSLPSDSPLWRTLFPSDLLKVEGRVPVDNSVKYLLQMRMNPTKELYSAVFVPAAPEAEADFKTLNSFLISKNRHGLVFPWGSRPKDYHPGRELYMVPLLQTDSLPEFLELFDDLKLPKTRSRDYLIGVWIINKGKLAPLPKPTLQAEPLSVSVVPPTLPHNQHVASPSVPFSATPPIPSLPVVLPSIHDPAALAAEVASLTPEQIQSVLRTLASTTQAIPLVAPTGAPPTAPFIPGQNQPWMGPPPASYPPGMPPQNTYSSPPQYNHERPNYDHRPPAGYDRDYERGGYDDRDRGRRGGERERGGQRGGRGRQGGRFRGRGRGGGGGRDDHDDRQRDSGWPRKGKDDGPPW